MYEVDGLERVLLRSCDRTASRASSLRPGSATIWSWDYQGNLFGEQQPTSSTGYVLNLRYPGQYYDAETNTNYNMFRTYEPATGRYLQSDPIGLEGGLSTYVYVKSNPLTAIDPTGLVGYIWQSGNNISIVLPIAFTGGTFDQQQAMAAAITSTWTGQFGQYHVVTTVINGSSMSIPVNDITIAPGSGDAQGLSRVFHDAKSGRWFAQPSRSQCLDYAHEAGHLMGLGEHPDSQTIMDNVYTTPTVWTAAGFTDTEFRCDDETGGDAWQREEHSAASSSVRRCGWSRNGA